MPLTNIHIIIFQSMVGLRIWFYVILSQHLLVGVFTVYDLTLHVFHSWGIIPEKLGGVCGLLPKTLTLFMTKICYIPYPIYDLTKNSKPYL